MGKKKNVEEVAMTTSVAVAAPAVESTPAAGINEKLLKLLAKAFKQIVANNQFVTVSFTSLAKYADELKKDSIVSAKVEYDIVDTNDGEWEKHMVSLSLKSGVELKFLVSPAVEKKIRNGEVDEDDEVAYDDLAFVINLGRIQAADIQKLKKFELENLFKINF